MKSITAIVFVVLSLFSNFVFAETSNSKTDWGRHIFENWNKGRQLNNNNSPQQGGPQYVAAYEKDPAWQKMFNDFVLGTQKVNGALQSSGQLEGCNKNVLFKMLEASEQFNETLNGILPVMVSNPTEMLNFGSFRVLSDANLNPNLVSLPIPSAIAVRQHLFSRGVNYNDNIMVLSNSSAIALPKVLAEQSRAFGMKANQTLQQDAKNLYLATLKDMATVAYLINKNPQWGVPFEGYVESVMMVYVRNKKLCLYDS